MARLNLQRMLIGKPLQTADQEHQHVSKKIGLAVFASDALSSTAYATEEILIILSIAAGFGLIGASAAGAGAGAEAAHSTGNLWGTLTDFTLFGSQVPILALSIPIALAIITLLTIVTISYRQTIYAYPNGGGAYIVARDNLGEVPAQIAGAALLTDYILTVAVSVSAGVAQITSAFPGLLPYKVAIAVGVVIIITVVNLRGVKESGNIFAVPTYFFLSMMAFTLIVGFIRVATGDVTNMRIDPNSVVPIHHDHLESLGLFLVLRAFSSGCTALTGIEAISNGITAFQKPASKNAAITLVWMSAILITLFVSITFMANQIQAIPSHTETVISQMGRAIFGQGSIFYYLVLAGTALILLMAANTSYADFPRLAALHAGDGFLPRQLTLRGSRLVFSWGIVVLAVTASLLIIIAQATVTALIPLYAVGVFLSFTMSQSGMVVRLWKIGKWQAEGKLKPGDKIKSLETEIEYEPHWFQHMLVSAVGGTCTFIVMMIFAITKFTSGAWFIVVLIPVLVYTFFQIHAHYKDVARTLSLKDSGIKPKLESAPVETVVLVDNVHTETYRMINFANSAAPDKWTAIHVGISPTRAEEVKQKWDTNFPHYKDRLQIIESPYRLLAEPIQEFIEGLQAKTPGAFVHVILGNLVMDTFWEQALHQNTALIFNLALGRMERVAVTAVPFQIHRTEGGHHALEANEKPKGVPSTDTPASDNPTPTA
jgi:amino acid transporter